MPLFSTIDEDNRDCIPSRPLAAPSTKTTTPPSPPSSIGFAPPSPPRRFNSSTGFLYPGLHLTPSSPPTSAARRLFFHQPIMTTDEDDVSAVPLSAPSDLTAQQQLGSVLKRDKKAEEEVEDNMASNSNSNASLLSHIQVFADEDDVVLADSSSAKTNTISGNSGIREKTSHIQFSSEEEDFETDSYVAQHNATGNKSHVHFSSDEEDVQTLATNTASPIHFSSDEEDASLDSYIAKHTTHNNTSHVHFSSDEEDVGLDSFNRRDSASSNIQITSDEEDVEADSHTGLHSRYEPKPSHIHFSSDEEDVQGDSYLYTTTHDTNDHSRSKSHIHFTSDEDDVDVTSEYYTKRNTYHSTATITTTTNDPKSHIQFFAEEDSFESPFALPSPPSMDAVLGDPHNVPVGTYVRDNLRGLRLAHRLQPPNTNNNNNNNNNSKTASTYSTKYSTFAAGDGTKAWTFNNHTSVVEFIDHDMNRHRQPRAPRVPGMA
ncbi:hypothetical protein DFJ77DRAFT_209152 [Powellomyces hirtus]|nr:hypothetical protein DFJ77DRAFT_209152 [Powellomyces hirtus]